MQNAIAIVFTIAMAQAQTCGTFDEANNALGPNRCWYDSECDGDRYCSIFQWCHGESNCPAVPIDPVAELENEVEWIEGRVETLEQLTNRMKVALVVAGIMQN